MPLPLLPVVMVTLVGVAYHQKTQQDKKKIGYGELTLKRQELYQEAMTSQSDPEKLRTLSKAFRAQGLPTHADMLEKRAKLREMSPELKAKRKEAFNKGMQCQDASKVYALANIYEREGCTGSAAALREHAAKLPPLHSDFPVTPPMPITQPPMPPIQPQTVIHGEPIRTEATEDMGPFTEDEDLPEPDPDDEGDVVSDDEESPPEG